MLPRRRLLPLCFAVLLSGGTVLVTHQWIGRAVDGQTLPEGVPAAPPARVLVVARPVTAGAALTAADLRWQEWPRDAAAPEYLSADDVAIGQVVGAVARTALSAGEPVTLARVAHPGDRGFLAAMLEPGYRAVTVSVTASTGVGGFVFPGDRVDLILTQLEPGGGAGGVRAETLLSDLRVLGVDQRASNEAGEVVVPQTATLEVTPLGAERIARAAEVGKLSLSLRSLGVGEAQREPAAESPRNLQPPVPRARRLVRASSSTATAPPPPPLPTTPPVRVIRGDQLSAQGGAR